MLFEKVIKDKVYINSLLVLAECKASSKAIVNTSFSFTK